MSRHGKAISAVLPDDLWYWLDEASKTTMLSKRAIVIKALTQYLNEVCPLKPSPTVRTTHVSLNPTNLDVMEQLEKDKAGYPLFTKDLLPYHQQPDHLYAEEVSSDD